MTFRPIRLVCLSSLLASVLFFAGCGVQETTDTMESDVTGYQCSQCNFKYYTDQSVFLSVCPECKTGTPMPVVGFVCPKDQRVMIVPQTASSAVCDQCKVSVIDKKIPQEPELKTWGAVKKTQ